MNRVKAGTHGRGVLSRRDGGLRSLQGPRQPVLVAARFSRPSQTSSAARVCAFPAAEPELHSVPGIPVGASRGGLHGETAVAGEKDRGRCFPPGDNSAENLDFPRMAPYITRVSGRFT